jgi:hypothetical protein
MVKRAQAAIDFLMTYGWALIVLTIVIAAMYLIFDFGKAEQSIPDACSFGDSFKCSDFQITPYGYVVLNLQNMVGTNIQVGSVICKYNNIPSASNTTTIDVPSGGKFSVSCDLNSTIIKKAKADVTLVFYKQGMSFPSSSDGVVVAVPQG